LYRHNLHNFIFKGQEFVYDLELLDWKRKKINFFDALDMTIIN